MESQWGWCAIAAAPLSTYEVERAVLFAARVRARPLSAPQHVRDVATGMLVTRWSDGDEQGSSRMGKSIPMVQSKYQRHQTPSGKLG